MNAYVITRETRFAYDTKIVFDKRDLVEDVESCNEVAHSLWPGDPSVMSLYRYYDHYDILGRRKDGK